MIADKIFKSFYLIEAEGKAIEPIIAGDFNLKKIVVSSMDFSNDMEAAVALRHVLDFITSHPEFDLAKAKETVDYNPEFFPYMTSKEKSEEEIAERKMMEARIEEIHDQLEEQGKQGVFVTALFDPIGDYVEARWVIESEDFTVKGRIAVNPDEYLARKGHDKMIDNMSAIRPRNNLSLH
jgi:hypothetical protein